MGKYPNKYGFEPRSQREADDLDAEAEYWKQRAADKANGAKGGNCFMVLLGLVVSFASFTTILFA